MRTQDKSYGVTSYMKKSTGKSFALVVLSAAMFAWVSVPAAFGKKGSIPPYNIILLTPDQLRAASMHTYGYPYPDTPNIDQLASKGTGFTQMHATAWTAPSFGVILTSLFLSVHGMPLPPYQSCGLSITRPLTTGKIPFIRSFLLPTPYKSIFPQLANPRSTATAVDDVNCWSIWDVAHNRDWD